MKTWRILRSCTLYKPLPSGGEVGYLYYETVREGIESIESVRFLLSLQHRLGDLVVEGWDDEDPRNRGLFEQMGAEKWLKTHEGAQWG
jgi:hypothetical protein